MSDFTPKYNHKMINYNFNNYVRVEDCLENIEKAYQQGRADGISEYDEYWEMQNNRAYMQGRADERKSILEWCKEQSRILKSQADDYDSEECFGGYNAFEAMIRHLEIVRGRENE